MIDPAPVAAETKDDRTALRKKRADEYFEEHLKGQRNWFSTKSSNYKRWSQWLAFIVIGAGGLITAVQVFQAEGAQWPIVVTCVLSLTVVLAKGLERIGNFEETWLSYRKASERMKREYRLYINGAGDYRDWADDEDRAYLHFVDQVEEIIAEEQQIYWQSRTSGGSSSSRTKAADGNGGL